MRRKRVGPLQSSQFLPLVFLPLWRFKNRTYGKVLMPKKRSPKLPPKRTQITLEPGFFAPLNLLFQYNQSVFVISAFARSTNQLVKTVP